MQGSGSGPCPGLGLALQPGHGLLQILHDELYLGPGGATAHAEAQCVPGHGEGDATAQQHGRRPGGGKGSQSRLLPRLSARSPAGGCGSPVSTCWPGCVCP